MTANNKKSCIVSRKSPGTLNNSHHICLGKYIPHLEGNAVKYMKDIDLFVGCSWRIGWKLPHIFHWRHSTRKDIPHMLQHCSQHCSWESGRLAQYCTAHWPMCTQGSKKCTLQSYYHGFCTKDPLVYTHSLPY